MGIITRMLKQTAVYWAPLGVDEFGQPTWDTPVEVAVRWEDRAEEFLNQEGDRQMSRSVVYVGQDVEVNGVLLLGELTSSVDQDDPKSNTGAWEIRRFEKLPNLRVTEYLRTVFL